MRGIGVSGRSERHSRWSGGLRAPGPSIPEAGGAPGRSDAGAARTTAPLPPVQRLPFRWPDWRLRGPSPPRAAILRTPGRARLRQIRDDHACAGRADALTGEEVLLPAPGRQAALDLADGLRLQGRESSPQGCQQQRDGFLFRRLCVCRCRPAAIIRMVCRHLPARAAGRCVDGSGNPSAPRPRTSGRCSSVTWAARQWARGSARRGPAKPCTLQPGPPRPGRGEAHPRVPPR